MPRSDLERRCRYDVAQSRSRTLSRCVNIADLRKHARRRLPGPVFDFLDGGAEDEVTLARNRLAFSEWALVPRVFRDVSEVSGEVELLGQRSEEHTSELQSLMRHSYAGFCLKKKKRKHKDHL